MADPIRPHARKRLWTKAGDSCAFTGCERPLLHPTGTGDEDTVVGRECHIVAKKDSPRVARSVSSLSEEEKVRWASLIEDPHGLANLVLMCGDHAAVIDDVNQGYTVEAVVEMKLVHEAEIEQRHRLPLEEIQAASPMPPTVLLLEDVPEWQRLATKALAASDPELLAWLEAEIGKPAEGTRVLDLIERWPEQLAGGPDELLNLLVREAEALGLWPAATTVWERLAERVDGAMRADRLARAAVDAGVGGEAEQRERLLKDAEALDPDGIRARLERFDDRIDPAEQLDFLAGLETEDQKLGALIAAQETVAMLRLGNVDGAERSLARAQELDPDSIAVRISRVNLEVQRARLALVEDKPFLARQLLDASESALELRETLLEMGRWEESVRLLMMAADAPGLMRDQEGARNLLERARAEEIGAQDGASVLGDAALRAGAPELALRFIEGHDGAEDLRRIEASARAEIGGAGRKDAIAELAAIALGDGPEAETAAISRLLLCLPPVSAVWDEQVARVAEVGEFEHQVVKLRVLTVAQEDPARALEMAAELPKEPWAAEMRLRVAAVANNPGSTKTAAEEFLAFAPDASGQLLAAQGLAQSGQLEDAGRVTAAIAEDPNAPPRVRNDAFHVLMKTLADRDMWEEAERRWQRWVGLCYRELAPSDGRISAWQVRVVHNRSRRPESG